MRRAGAAATPSDEWFGIRQLEKTATSNQNLLKGPVVIDAGFYPLLSAAIKRRREERVGASHYVGAEAEPSFRYAKLALFISALRREMGERAYS